MIKRTKWDDAFSTLVRARAGWRCQRCDQPFEPRHARGLDCSHFIGRAKQATRWLPINGFALCYGCHSLLGSRPQDHIEFVKSKLSEKDFNTLMDLKHRTVKALTDKQKQRLWQQMTDELFRLRQCEATGEDFMHFSLPEAERIILQFDEGGV